MDKTDLAEVLPIDEFFDGGMITTYGDVVFAIEVSLPAAHSCTEEKLARLSADLAKAIIELEEGALVQKMDYFYPMKFESDYTGTNEIIQWEHESIAKRPIMSSHSEWFISFKMNKKSLAPLKNAIRGIGHIAMRTSKKDVDRINEVKNVVENFCNTLTIIGLDHKVMNETQIRGAVARYLSGNYGADFPQVDAISITEKGVRSGTEHVGCLTAYKYPKRFKLLDGIKRRIVDGRAYDKNSAYRNNCALGASLLFPLGMAMPFKHCLIQSIEVLDNDLVVSKFNKQGVMAVPFRIFSIGQGQKEKDQAIGEFKKAIDENGLTSCHLGVDCIVWADTEDELKKYMNDLKTISSTNLGLYLRIENIGTATSFWNGIPGCRRASKDWNISFVEIACDVLHMEGVYHGDVEGIPLQDIFGNPFYFDDTSKEYVEAFHWVLYAPTSSGKSIFVNKKANAGYARGHHIVIIDAGKKGGSSYMGLVEFHGGLLFDANDLDGFKGNPFVECPKDEFGKWETAPRVVDRSRGEIDPVVSFYEYVKALIKSIWKYEGQSKNERDAKIGDSLLAYYRKMNEIDSEELPSFDGWYNFVLNEWYDSIKHEIKDEYFDIQSFTAVCRDFTKHESAKYQKLLNSSTSRDLLKERIICYDLEPIKDRPLLGSLILTMALFQAKRKIMLGDGSHVQILMDESEPFLHGAPGEYVADMFAKIRADNASIGVVAQSINQHLLLANAITTKILGNVFTKYILDHSRDVANQIPVLIKELSLGENAKEVLEKMGSAFGDKNEYRLVAIFQSGRTILARNYLAPQGFALFNTDNEKRKEIREFVERYGSLRKGVNEWCKKRMT